MRKSCKNCIYMVTSSPSKKSKETMTFGDCHRYPPTLPGRGFSVNYPAVHFNQMAGREDWCGEHKPIEVYVPPPPTRKV